MGALRDLLDWWTALSDVEKASRESAEKLIRTTESILADERSWQQVENKKDPGGGMGDAAGGADEDDMEEGAARDGARTRSKVAPAP